MGDTDRGGPEAGSGEAPTVSGPPASPGAAAVSAESPGADIGPYRLRDLLGEGGFGVVWLAEQMEPVRRRVALKIIKPGMDSKAVIARFEAERQALALMDHAGIAKVFDAGMTPTGRPYFAMEYVPGVPITEHCDRQKLPLRARLELFAQVCDAVHHAHMKGIIHRDLKPGNILVAARDQEAPAVKVIDFGVAKATQMRLTEKTVFTEMGTPLACGSRPLGIAVARVMTGPGLDDIEVAHSGTGFLENTVMVFENRGGLAFQSCPVPVGPQPTSVEPDDVDGDGRLDLVVVSAGDGTGEGSVILRMNNGLQPPTWGGPSFAVGVNPRSVRCVDLNNDGRREVVSANVGDGTLSVLVNTGAPNSPAFAPQVALPAGNLNGSITALDLDSDGDRDLAAIADGQVRVLRNDLTQGQIAFAPGAAPPGGAGQPILLDQADVDGDNRADLITLRDGADTGALTDVRPNTSPGVCYANCDSSTQQPVLNVADFTCFLQRYAAGEPYANCDASTQPPVLNVADFTCFLQKYASGCP